jgi:hypothetical protein
LTAQIGELTLPLRLTGRHPDLLASQFVLRVSQDLTLGSEDKDPGLILLSLLLELRADLLGCRAPTAKLAHQPGGGPDFGDQVDVGQSELERSQEDNQNQSSQKKADGDNNNVGQDQPRAQAAEHFPPPNHLAT